MSDGEWFTKDGEWRYMSPDVGGAVRACANGWIMVTVETVDASAQSMLIPPNILDKVVTTRPAPSATVTDVLERLRKQAAAADRSDFYERGYADGMNAAVTQVRNATTRPTPSARGRLMAKASEPIDLAAMKEALHGFELDNDPIDHVRVTRDMLDHLRATIPAAKPAPRIKLAVGELWGLPVVLDEWLPPRPGYRFVRKSELANDWGTRTEPGGPVTDKDE